jgi:NitT/TauT family transport system substrate-binding protein
LAAAQDRPRIYLGASSKTLGYSPLWVGVKRGFFEQQGLDVQLILLRGVPMTLQALAASSLQIGSGGPEPYIEASERGLDSPFSRHHQRHGPSHYAGKNYKSMKICAAPPSAPRRSPAPR